MIRNTYDNNTTAYPTNDGGQVFIGYNIDPEELSYNQKKQEEKSACCCGRQMCCRYVINFIGSFVIV